MSRSDHEAHLAAAADNNVDTKAELSAAGWAFLINDTNDFVSVFSGRNCWSDEQRFAAGTILRTRRDTLQARGIGYFKFIVPEKATIYPEYLPDHRRLAEILRPAQLIQADNPDFVLYLDVSLISAKSFGLLYFRGDTHPNWLGAWFIYRSIMRTLLNNGAVTAEYPLDMKRLHPSIAGFEGDLINQVLPADRSMFEHRLIHTLPSYGFEVVLKLDILEPVATRVVTPAIYAAQHTTRETFVFERPGAGQRAVIFRDSTFDRGLMELIAQHFVRSVFIWNQGNVDLTVIDHEVPDVVIHCMAERFITQYPASIPFINVPHPS